MIATVHDRVNRAELTLRTALRRSTDTAFRRTLLQALAYVVHARQLLDEERAGGEGFCGCAACGRVRARA